MSEPDGIGKSAAQSNRSDPGRTMMITPRKSVSTAIHDTALTFSARNSTDSTVMNNGRVTPRWSAVANGKGDVKAEIGPKHHQPAQRHFANARAEQGAQAAIKMREGQQERDRGPARDDHGLIQRIAARDQLQIRSCTENTLIPAIR